jgi:hypothetical protein
MTTKMIARGMQQPDAAPNFLCLPCLVEGIPVAREILPFTADIPVALFQEKDVPNFLPIFRSPSTIVMFWFFDRRM